MEAVAGDHQAADTQEVIVRVNIVFLLFNASAGVTKLEICSRRSSNHSELFLKKKGMFCSSYPSTPLQLPPTASLCTQNHNINTMLYSSPEGNRLAVIRGGQSAGSAGSRRDAETYSSTLTALVLSFTAAVVS